MGAADFVSQTRTECKATRGPRLLWPILGEVRLSVHEGTARVRGVETKRLRGVEDGEGGR